jgi:hypothetical protein
MMRVVLTWPGNFDVTRSLNLGFTVDGTVDQIVQRFMDEQGLSAASYRQDSARDPLR